MEQKNLEKIDTLVRRWGVPLQLILTMEEASELATVCSKVLRGYGTREKLVDSLADMYVMLQTMCMVYGVTPEELEAIAGNKLDTGLAKPYEEQQEKPQGEPPVEEEKK